MEILLLEMKKKGLKFLMQTATFMEQLNKSNTQSQTKPLSKEEVRNLIRDSLKVRTTENIKNQIFTTIQEIQKRTFSGNKWELLKEDLQVISEAKRNTQAFKDFHAFVQDLDSFKDGSVKSLERKYKKMKSNLPKALGKPLADFAMEEVEKKLQSLNNKNSVSKKSHETNSFNTWMRAERKKRNLSLKELSAQTGISSSYISLMETSKEAHPSADILKKIATAFQISESEIPSIDGKKRKKQTRGEKQIATSQKREQTLDLYAILQNENVQVRRRILNEEERSALIGCMDFIFDKRRDFSDLIRFFNQAQLLK